MANVNKVQGTPNTIVIGTTGVQSTGLITSASDRTTGDKIVITGNDGWDQVVIYLNTRNEWDFEVIMDASTVIPTRGSTIAFNNNANYGAVEECTVSWANKSEKKLRITGVKHSGVTYS